MQTNLPHLGREPPRAHPIRRPLRNIYSSAPARPSVVHASLPSPSPSRRAQPRAPFVARMTVHRVAAAHGDSGCGGVMDGRPWVDTSGDAGGSLRLPRACEANCSIAPSTSPPSLDCAARVCAVSEACSCHGNPTSDLSRVGLMPHVSPRASPSGFSLHAFLSSRFTRRAKASKALHMRPPAHTEPPPSVCLLERNAWPTIHSPPIHVSHTRRWPCAGRSCATAASNPPSGRSSGQCLAYLASVSSKRSPWLPRRFHTGRRARCMFGPYPLLHRLIRLPAIPCCDRWPF